jgi:nucleoside-diphosphate-sugar epimerase
VTGNQAAPSVLVLGSTGRLGSILRNYWRNRPDVIWQARRCHEDALPFRTEEDLLNDAGLGKLRVSAVLALWGVVPGTGQDLHNNTKLALKAMQLGSKLGADRVLHCSSAAVYQPFSAPLGEDTPPRPQGAYGHAKLEMELALRNWRGKFGKIPSICMMRIGNVMGADSLSASMRAAAGTGQKIKLDRFADGRAAYRSFLSGADLARCLTALTECPIKELPEIVNLAAPQATAMDAVLRHAGLEFAWQDAPPHTAPRVELETARLRKLLDLGPDSATPAHLLADWPWPEVGARDRSHLKGPQP